MDLYQKYNVPVPRYTSYPTVPYWNGGNMGHAWKGEVRQAFAASNGDAGISLYIHLPYCESLCTYCACNTRITVNHKVEEPYINALLKEWDLYLQVFGGRPRIKEIHLGGGTPTFFSPRNLENLITRLLSTAEVCRDHDFSFEGHPANTTAEHLYTLHKLGFRRVSFGIQDFDEKVQSAIIRRQTYEEVAHCIAVARYTGYTSVNLDLIYGLPFQTLTGLMETIQKVLLLQPERIAFYSYAHVPWLKPGQRLFTEKDLPSNLEKRRLYEEGKALLTANGYYDVGMDHFALPGDALHKAALNKQLHRNFMGYTPNYTRLLVGLGVSAISDAWTSFSQNVKTVEDYLLALDGNELPLYKGHILDLNDLFLRRIILDIMCHFETSWNEADLQNEAFRTGLERLDALATDGLIEKHACFLKVTEKGRPFLRNICMCFDEHYWRAAKTDKLFSTSI